MGRDFANSIGAEWKPSNVGLDDIVLGNTAWGAKTVKANPKTAKTVRLISGRNSPVYSFGEKIDNAADPNVVGPLILNIWNERVSAIREKYKNLRTVVLLKGEGLKEVAIFEFETIRYDVELFHWQWNKNQNLEGYNKATNNKTFTWQPHGSQFTITEAVPQEKLVMGLKSPPAAIDKEKLLQSIGFDESWITVKNEPK